MMNQDVNKNKMYPIAILVSVVVYSTFRYYPDWIKILGYIIGFFYLSFIGIKGIIKKENYIFITISITFAIILLYAVINSLI